MKALNRDWYALSDQEAGKHLGAFPITKEQAIDWNEKNFGIFWTVNDFDGPRKIENLRRINSWAIDVDDCDKGEFTKQLMQFCYPSLVVETKRGFHVYWHAKEATLENYQAIVLDRLVFIFNADPKARDVSRILRVPGYFHCKDPNDKFQIKAVWEFDVSYTEDQMFYNFPLPEEASKESEAKQELRRELRADGNDLWEKVYNLDCEEALLRLSGKAAVGCEQFSFRRVSNGNLNILVNGKSTSCWIDSNKRIGSMSKGGPTIWQWINWYQHNHKRTYQIMKEEFPELWK